MQRMLRPKGPKPHLPDQSSPGSPCDRTRRWDPHEPGALTTMRLTAKGTGHDPTQNEAVHASSRSQINLSPPMTPEAQQCAIVEVCRTFQTSLGVDVRDVEVQRVIDHIHTSLFEETLTVGTALEACGVRSHTFNARFKKELVRVGRGVMSVQRYIECRRLHVARQLLERPGIEITLIAIYLGFGSHERFLRTWRRHFGCAPSAYRAKC
jgi:AraC-like DNA-binding protein